MKKKILVASFFSVLMLMTPFTAVTGSIDDTADNNGQGSITAVIKLTEDEIRLLREIFYRIFNGEMELTEEQIRTLEEIANKLDYAEIELTEAEIRLLREIFCRIFNGEMELTDDEIRILGDILSKIAYAEIEPGEQIGDKITESGEILDSYDGRIPLTESQISRLDDFVNSFEDNESRELAQEIVDQLVTADGELDLSKLETILGGYAPLGIVINSIKEKLWEIIIQFIQEWLQNYFSHGRSGWLIPTASFFYNITTLLQNIKYYFGKIKEDIEIIRAAIQAFITFIGNPCIQTLINLVIALYKAWIAAQDVWNKIQEFPEPIWSYVEGIWINASTFIPWFLPDKFDPDNYTKADRPYNQPVHINIKVFGADDLSNVKVYCDDTYYTPNPDGTLEIDYITYNPPYKDEKDSLGEHWFKLKAWDYSTNPYTRINATDHAFSYANINLTIDFSGKPVTLYGPTDVVLFDYHLYFTCADNPKGDKIYYQWNWSERPLNPGPWYESPKPAGNLISRPHIWLFRGKHEVRVRVGDTPDGSGWVSPWSEPLNVMVHGLIFDGNTQNSQSTSQSSTIQSTDDQSTAQSTSQTTDESGSQSNSY